MNQLSECLKDYVEHDWGNKVKKRRKEFIDKYPEEKILKLSQNEYQWSGKKNTFCYCLQADLHILASMGNVFPPAYGVYVDKSGNRKLSKGLDKLFKGDCEKAFQYQKEQIVALINAGKSQNYDAIKNSVINQILRYKILLVYCPDLYFPVCTRNAAEDYCNVFGIKYTKSEDMLDLVLRLTEFSNEVLPSDWDLHMAMKFAVWLLQNKKTYYDSYKSIRELLKTEEKLNTEIESYHLEGEEKEAVVKVRVNQGVYRESLLKIYSKCCLCGVTDPHLLVASHIKPWSKCEKGERLDPNNGLLLCPNHDKLFDGGFISFDSEMRIKISSYLSESDRVFMNVSDEMSIEYSDERNKYMQYHRESVFEKFLH